MKYCAYVASDIIIVSPDPCYEIISMLYELSLKGRWLIGLNVYKTHISSINLCIIIVWCLLNIT